MSDSPNPHLAGHFADMPQQREAGTLGMWAFLATEVVFFGALFAGYSIYRNRYPQAFAFSSHHMDITLGTINTFVLLFSSLTMALSLHAAQTGKRKALVGLMLLTMVLGSAFLGIKAVEYAEHFRHGLAPGRFFHFTGSLPPGVNPGQVQLFFFFYFVMTGIHALHLIIGIILLGILAVLGWRGHFTPQYPNPVELAGLYWHFVDIVWIFLFPLLYLIGPG